MEEKLTYRGRWYTQTKVIIAALLLLLTLGMWIVLSFIYPTTSPLSVIGDFVFSKQHPHKHLTRYTLAFLPYWRLEDTRYTRFDLLSEINYFSLTVDRNGEFVTALSHEPEPGWVQWNSQLVKDLIAKTQITGGKFTLTIAAQRNKSIEGILTSITSQKRLIANILSQVNTRHLNGVIMDFEYQGLVKPSYTQAFTLFSKRLSTALKASPFNPTLSLTLLPLTMRDKGLFNVSSLLPLYDRFIGMSYDYYGASSTIAGPVAPLTGFKQGKYFFDVTTTYEDYLTVIPKSKLLMGIPYYGWDFAVEEGKEIQSKTFPLSDNRSYAGVLSYGRMRGEKYIKSSNCSWDDYAKAPWCFYTDTHHIDHQVWFENNRSLALKYVYAKALGISGIAIWTLGYDKQYPDLWNIIERTFL